MYGSFRYISLLLDGIKYEDSRVEISIALCLIYVTYKLSLPEQANIWYLFYQSNMSIFERRSDKKWCNEERECDLSVFMLALINTGGLREDKNHSETPRVV